jgi:hypothetical protein
MTNYVNRADAVVALKSFGRRYRELILGPVGDDAWERLVRYPGAEGKSAVEYVAVAIDDLGALAAAASLISRTPSDEAPIPEPVSNRSSSHSIAELQALVQRASQAASGALDDRLDEDYDKQVHTVSGQITSVGEYVSEVVHRLAANLRHGEAAIEEARADSSLDGLR